MDYQPSGGAFLYSPPLTPQHTLTVLYKNTVWIKSWFIRTYFIILMWNSNVKWIHVPFWNNKTMSNSWTCLQHQDYFYISAVLFCVIYYFYGHLWQYKKTREVKWKGGEGKCVFLPLPCTLERRPCDLVRRESIILLLLPPASCLLPPSPELCLNLLSGYKSFFSLTHKSTPVALGVKPFTIPPSPPVLTGCSLTQTAKKSVDIF